MTPAKPRIRLDRVVRPGGRSWRGWRCDGDGCTGFAVTPWAAFLMWRWERRQQQRKAATR